MTSVESIQLPRQRKTSSQSFRFLKQFNEPEFAKKINCRDRLRKSDTRWFPGDYLSSVFARALCDQQSIPFKETLESFEFYACVRKYARAESMVDLCCGHGLVGILFAMFERKVERVMLLDKMRPPSFDAVLRAAVDVAPWVGDKIQYVVSRLEDAATHIEPNSTILGVHACGDRTDQCINLATETGGAVALLPCCRNHRYPLPPSLRKALGADIAIDVDRTYRLHAAGFHVRWDEIPPSITPMNRVLVGIPPKQPAAGVTVLG